MTPDFLFQAMIYLAAAVIVVPLAKRLGLGSVLGYLLAGILIGPYLLGFIGEEGEELMHFAEFGVVMMLFLVGLELEPALLWRMRIPILGMGGMQVALSAVVLGGLAYLMGLSWQESTAVGLTFALSSTAIVLQTLGERGQLNSSGGRSSFAVLLFQDIAVIPILAVMPLLALGEIGADGEGHGGASGLLEGLPAGLRAGATLLAIAILVVAGRYLVPPLLRVVARARQRELLTGVALLLIVAVAVLMSAVGLSPALGSFLGGVVLANSYYKHELESDLEPFKGLLLGLFFMAVGASIDFGLIAARPGTVIGLVLLLVVVKALVLFVTGRVFGLAQDQNALFSFGLAQTGEFAFVLLSLIQQEGILPQSVVALLLVVVAVSMALTPLIMLVNARYIQPRFGVKESVDDAPPPEIEEPRRIIVAGFGGFGAVVGRFLGANGVRATILDNDSDRVDLLRRMGFEVYYGDATRFDLLETAGAAGAEAIVIGLPSPEQNLRLVETVKKHFPHLHQIVRAFDYPDTYDLMDAGVLHIFRDTLYSGVAAGKQTLKLLGVHAYRLERNGHRFFRHDLAALQTLAGMRFDEDLYVDAVRGSVADLEAQLRSDYDQGAYGEYGGWDIDGMAEEE
ncbi:CPA2 family monovalent cation:H+ antiporter-2/glutathione-regulated potassium-efflux system protein KefB [Lewinella aquimaris]|uniref:CPA2 family monovalent cation:H+ antiporter-2/glutathione-regulated potassium-efflux system protein KefB n=1 Tax=Neolewinella aquimaris TaxID=1835722 RepID=A0A840DWY7_9BACT|nr:monovalent cation:proton antiporter-2 (CPA2) family protein [Neolewinella aquimaris]MBB4077521.1 CPA2 family monovalent cation:H+ antiporter-2/glutathione-regulated potassium-efflux system protein KefB [Neolewinella aquimaris]